MSAAQKEALGKDVFNVAHVRIVEATRIKLYLPGLGGSSAADDEEPSRAASNQAKGGSEAARKARRKLLKMQGYARATAVEESTTAQPEVVVVQEALVESSDEDDDLDADGTLDGTGRQTRSASLQSLAQMERAASGLGAGNSAAAAGGVAGGGAAGRGAGGGKKAVLFNGRPGGTRADGISSSNNSPMRRGDSREQPQEPRVPIWERGIQAQAPKEKPPAPQPKTYKAVQPKTMMLGGMFPGSRGPSTPPANTWSGQDQGLTHLDPTHDTSPGSSAWGGWQRVRESPAGTLSAAWAAAALRAAAAAAVGDAQGQFSVASRSSSLTEKRSPHEMRARRAATGSPSPSPARGRAVSPGQQQQQHRPGSTLHHPRPPPPIDTASDFATAEAAGPLSPATSLPSPSSHTAAAMARTAAGSLPRGTLSPRSSSVIETQGAGGAASPAARSPLHQHHHHHHLSQQQQQQPPGAADGLGAPRSPSYGSASGGGGSPQSGLPHQALHDFALHDPGSGAGAGGDGSAHGHVQSSPSLSRLSAASSALPAMLYSTRGPVTPGLLQRLSTNSRH